MLTQATIDVADWKKGEGAIKKKVRGARSVNVFDIIAFQGDVATAPPTPIQHTVLQLTEAKANAQQAPGGYEPPAGSNLPIPWATTAGKKRKRMGDGDDDSDASPKRATTTRKTTTTSEARRRYRTEKSVSRELWPLEPPLLCARTPPPAHCLTHHERAEWL